MIVERILLNFFVSSVYLTFLYALTCKTPSNQQRDCIPILDCAPLLSTIRNSINDSQLRKYIRQHQCAYRPKQLFCCPRKINKLPKAKDGICGKSLTENLPTRITGGEKAHLGEFPWTSMLIYSKPNNISGSHCGGSLITNVHTLSAAHCVDPRSLPPTWKLSKIRLGEFDLETDVDCDKIDQFLYCAFPPIDIDAAEYFVHDLYVPTEQGNPHDIAIIRMSEAVNFSNFIKPVCLPIATEDNINIDFGTVTVAGFGRTESNHYSMKLLKAEIDIVEHHTCSDQYKMQGRLIHDSQICATRTDTDSCDGDSGNALIKQHELTRVMYQVGIVSYGPKRCGKGYPGIYINVIEFIEWIKNKIET